MNYTETPNPMKALIYIGGWKLTRDLQPKALERELQDIADQYGKPVLAELQGNGPATLSYIVPKDYPIESLCTAIGRSSQQCVADTPQKAKELYMATYSPDTYYQCPSTGAYVFKYVFDLYNAGNESGAITAWKVEQPKKKAGQITKEQRETTTQ